MAQPFSYLYRWQFLIRWRSALPFTCPDAQSMPGVIRLHEQLYGSGMLESIATDKGYYSYDNERLLLDKCVY
ncbi:hypothetical protein PGH45_00020 [Legionella pneumophila]|nr:hypothetical protein [Legionella pneumophila]